MGNIIRVSELTKAYGQKAVLDRIDLDVPEGSTVALLGPNGAGKTTLIRILATLLAPDSGRATIAGHDVVREPHQVRQVISLTGQFTAVDELLTGEENMRLMTRLWNLRGTEGIRRGQALLERFDLQTARKRQVRHYSGGMRRKLDLALSLVARPRVLFLDEPTTGLDPRSRLAMWETVRELARNGTTVLLTTQYLEEADQLAGMIVMIDHGRILAQGTPGELKREIFGARVGLHFGSDALFQQAACLLGGRATADATIHRSLLVETGTGTDIVHALLNELADANVRVERMSVHEPTLDDVFLHLTGRNAAPGKAA